MFFVDLLGMIMNWCYSLFHDYGLAIIFFTILSKILLLPLSILVQKNSIKMVKMQPSINTIKINYFGDKDKIADEEAKLYKKEKYNAFASLIPLTIQILLLLGLVTVINHPITYLVDINPEDVSSLIDITLENHSELERDSSSLEIITVEDIKKGEDLAYQNVVDSKTIQEIRNLNLTFLGINLSWVAVTEQGIAYLIPIIAGLSALLLCLGQNKMNVLQNEQSKKNQIGMLLFSVGLSLYLGMFVVAGVALYWTASNLLAILLQWLLNIWINPKKYVDYQELEKTNQELKELNNLNKKNPLDKNKRKKAKKDYKRFFRVVNKHLVFYSESNGFYKYYKGFIEYILKNTNLIIHYITSDYDDAIFELEKRNPRIKAYFIDEKRLITLMMKMDADVVVMTMPDLENYHIKRSYIRKDIQYILLQHGVGSMNLTYRPHATDYYDIVYTSGKSQYDEMIATNKMNHLDRTIIKCGYPTLDDMIEEYQEVENKQKIVLIAPSWQKDNIIDLCLEQILNSLDKNSYQIIIRPHPQHVRHQKRKFEQMKEQYKREKNIEIQTDFSSHDSVLKADVLITDWSDVGYEYAFTTKKPVIFIDTPMKVMNPDYKKLGIEPFNIWAREKVGQVISLDQLETIDKVVKDMLKNKKKYQKDITDFTKENIYHLGSSAKVGAKYMIEVVQRQINKRKSR